MRLLINSMPKSGTHLLIKTIELLGYQNFLNNLFKKVLSKLGLWVPSSLIYDPSSPTFRRGQVGAWKDEFPANLLKEFNSEMEDVLRTLGYDV